MDQLQNNARVEDLSTEHTSSRKKPNGIVKFDNEGSMWYREPHEDDETAWKRAIWHDDIRDWLISFTNQNGAYTYGREKGHLDNDVTSFHREHASWGYEIEHRPEILFQFEPLERKDPEYNIGPWIHRGCVVLDADNHPVRNFKEIPLTCSTKIEPWLQETLRRMHSKITANDFRARMLRDPTGQGLRGSNGEWKGTGKDPLLSAATYDFQMTRFRQKHRCISWVKRGGSTAFRDYLWSIMTPEMRKNNTTRGLGDIVDRGELAKMSLANKGKTLARAGARAISDVERKRRRAKEEARAANFDQRQAAQITVISKKRKRASSTKEGKEKMRLVLTSSMLSGKIPLPAESTRSSEEYEDTYNNKDNHKNHHDKWDGRYQERLNNVWDGQGYEDGEESTVFDTSAGNHAHSRSLSALMRPNKKSRTAGAHEEHTLHAFDQGASYIAQSVAWAEQYTSFASVSTTMSPEGTPDTVEALTPTGDNTDTNGRWESDNVTEFNDGQGFLDKTPCTPEEKLLIHHLLEPSKEHYTSYTSQIPPATDSNMSYLWQYGELSGGLTGWWRSHGQGSVRPVLLGLVGCTRSQLTWNTQSPPQISVDIRTLLNTVFSEDLAQEEPVLNSVGQEPETAWDDDHFKVYNHLDRTDSPPSIPSKDVVGYF